MKIIINAASIYKGGAEQVVNSFINECRSISRHQFHIFLCDNILNSLDWKNFESNFYFYRIEKRPATSLLNLVKTIRYFDRLEKKIKPDFVISTGGHGYWIPDAPLIVGFNYPHYIYSDSPYFSMLSIRRKVYWKLKKQFDLLFYKRADAILAQTEDVKKRVKELLPQKPVYTVSNTINGVFNHPVGNDHLLPPKSDNEFRLLTVSSNYRHKNLDVIPHVIDYLLSENITHVRFILTLPEKPYENLISNGKREYVTNVGPVSIDRCPALYRECDIMFLPTLLECFSASYVEAMAMNLPILTSDLPFARTVCGDAAEYFNPVNPEDIADKIKKLINDKERRDELIEKGRKIFGNFLTPDARAEKYLAIGEKHVYS